MKVIFACAGSGGHVNPAIAIANILKKREKNCEILFIGTKTGLENDLVKEAGYPIKHIETGKIIRSFTFKNIKALTSNLKGIQDAKKIIKEFQPDIVIGTGGYICGPVMLSARKCHVPYVLHESNAFPGVAVKLLAKKASHVMISFEDARKRLKNRDNIVYTGTPAKFNEEKFDSLDVTECRKKLGLQNIHKKIVLVTCGSQGAAKINETILEMVSHISNEKVFFVLITGQKNYETVLKQKEKIEQEKKICLDPYLRLEKFVFQMDVMYKAVDMCITRAGAMTITELALAKKPAILIPLPTAAENHQLYNARVLEKVNAGKIIEQKDLTITLLNDTIEEMIQGNCLQEMANNAKQVVVKGVEDKIYHCIKNSLKK